jgi:hypothetical protein
MPYSRNLTRIACAVAFALGAAASAQAATPVLEVTDTLSASDMSNIHAFNITAPGTYIATLIDNALFVAFDDVGLGITKTGGATLGSILAPGSFSFDAAVAGSYTAVVGGVVGAGPIPIGTYGVTIAAIPEAETWAMMLVGMGLVGWQLRRKVKISAASRFV